MSLDMKYMNGPRLGDFSIAMDEPISPLPDQDHYTYGYARMVSRRISYSLFHKAIPYLGHRQDLTQQDSRKGMHGER